ncbi:MAG: DUF1015 domain-containing protein [Spirochaetaceae bacterium]|nr:DUF1015 domain-containing protein [Spirochaetaceae bacterium]
MDVYKRLAALGLAVPELLLPKPEIDLSKWAVIACDQFTQDRSYWDKVFAAVGDAPSTLNLIYPEVYLEDADRAERIASIHKTMRRYLADPAAGSADGVFAPPVTGCMYIERRTGGTAPRRGILAALDLECYDWKPGRSPMIRPTEGTLPERIPPRTEIRREAALESSHILILIDDEENKLIPELGALAKSGSERPAYSTRLMGGGGEAAGWLLGGKAHWDRLAGGLEKLARRAAQKYDAEDGAPFLYAVGDGNHSLAAAKAVWEEYKQAHRDERGLMDHPARWALAEIENLYDPALTFEPIHRVMFNTPAGDIQKLLADLPGYRCRRLGPGNAAALAAMIQDTIHSIRFGLVTENEYFLVEAHSVPLAADALQPLLDAYAADHPGVTVDYIHGADELFRIAGNAPGKSAGTGENAGPVTGILLPPFRKQDLFITVAGRGPLPRKTFSLGNAEEKRFYLECRKLFG